MIITPIRTGKITPGNQNIYDILDAHLPPLKDGSIVAVTSKIIAICEGRVAPAGEAAIASGDARARKSELVKQEADRILPAGNARYHIMLTMKRNMLIPTAGIDESNGNGSYILWPSDPQKSANEIRAHLKKRFGIKEVGVLVTDSATTPLRRGTRGVALAESGFKALKNYIGKPDIFGRKLKVTMGNVMEGLAAAAVVVMGEGNEQTPLAVIEEVPFVEFQKRNPSKPELAGLAIEPEDDLYAPLLTSVKWEKGGGGARNASDGSGARDRADNAR